MPRVFNTAGPCLPEDHYMLSPTRRLGQIRDLIDGKFYFVIHAARQMGKTTLLRTLSRELTAEGKYAAITVSLENFNSPDPTEVMPQILRQIQEAAHNQLPKDLKLPAREQFVSDPLMALQSYLEAWSRMSPRPVVVFFDEIDALEGKVLISVLRQLRNGYTSRPAPFPQSVALVGMRDVRDYKVKARADSDTLGSSSPFNIKMRSLTLRCFNQEEVEELLLQHTHETGQRFAPEAIREVYAQTCGQPWLVNALAAQLVTSYDALVKDRSVEVTREKVIDAREILIERRDTHLDSLVERLREERVRKVIEPILIGEAIAPDVYNDDLKYVEDLGLVNRENGTTRIANPIYQEVIPRVLTYVIQGNIPDDPAWYVDTNGTLNIDKLIKGFLQFWLEHGEVLLRGMPYQEAAPHLSFMAYLQRIVNSGGRIEREFAIGTGRADLVVEYGGRRDVIEIKLARAYKALERGLEQVAGYAKRLGRNRGYLLIFNTKGKTSRMRRGKVEQVKRKGVTVVVVRA
jgi:hypothetical protein